MSKLTITAHTQAAELSAFLLECKPNAKLLATRGKNGMVLKSSTSVKLRFAAYKKAAADARVTVAHVLQDCNVRQQDGQDVPAWTKLISVLDNRKRYLTVGDLQEPVGQLSDRLNSAYSDSVYWDLSTWKSKQTISLECEATVRKIDSFFDDVFVTKPLGKIDAGSEAAISIHSQPRIEQIAEALRMKNADVVSGLKALRKLIDLFIVDPTFIKEQQLRDASKLMNRWRCASAAEMKPLLDLKGAGEVDAMIRTFTASLWDSIGDMAGSDAFLIKAGALRIVLGEATLPETLLTDIVRLISNSLLDPQTRDNTRDNFLESGGMDFKAGLRGALIQAMRMTEFDFHPDLSVKTSVALDAAVEMIFKATRDRVDQLYALPRRMQALAKFSQSIAPEKRATERP